MSKNNFFLNNNRRLSGNTEAIEDSDSFLVNSSLVMESLETSGKKTSKLSCQVIPATADIMSHQSGLKRNNAGRASLLHILRTFRRQTVAYVASRLTSRCPHSLKLCIIFRGASI